MRRGPGQRESKKYKMKRFQSIVMMKRKGRGGGDAAMGCNCNGEREKHTESCANETRWMESGGGGTCAGVVRMRERERFARFISIPFLLQVAEAVQKGIN